MRLAVPSLAAMCMEALTGALRFCDDLGDMDGGVRARFAEAVCRARAMDGHAFALFAAPGVGDVYVPDCAGVDEPAMRAALAALSPQELRALVLRHCGRGMTDATMRVASRACFGGLRALCLDGPHVLTDGALGDALAHAPHLTRLRLGSSPVLTGAFLARLPALTPRLEELELERLARLGDAQLVGGAGGGGAGGGGGGAGGGGGGVLGLRHLTALALAHLPGVTDAPLLQLLAAAADRRRAEGVGAGAGAGAGAGGGGGGCLTRLRLDSCPRITDAALAALVEHGAAPALASLELQSMPQLSAAAVRALAARCTRLQRLSLKRCVLLDADAPLIFAVQAGGSLRDVDLSGLPALTDAALVALARHAGATLRRLDVSMCRGVTDAGLGSVADACGRLERLVLWGCTQLTGAFFLGHARAAAAPSAWDAVPAAAGAPVPLRIFGRPGDVLPAPDADDGGRG